MKPLSECVATLTELIQQGQTLEAMERFYADDVTMQENEQPLRIGKAVCLAHERSNLADINELQAKLINQAINEQTGVVFSEWYMEATYSSGKRFAVSEVSVQQWSDNLIVVEKFYYSKIQSLIQSLSNPE